MEFFHLTCISHLRICNQMTCQSNTWVDQFTWAYNDYFYLSEVATWLCSESSITSGRQVIISLWMSSDTIVIISNILSANSCKRVNSLVNAVQDKCTSSLKHTCYLSSIHKNNMYTRYNLISGTVNGTEREWFFSFAVISWYL